MAAAEMTGHDSSVVVVNASYFVAAAAGGFAIGLGRSATFLGATAVISDLTDPSERGAALGFNDLLVSQCSAVAGLLGGLVFEGAGFRILGFGVATLMLIVVLGVARLREPSPVRVRSG
ncbi:MAG: MFS transporter [Actinomycetota bacterium]